MNTLEKNKCYWSDRAPSYSEINRLELSSSNHENWKRVITDKITSTFEQNTSDVKILEVGTGPGFFAILLAEEGYNVTAIDLTPNMLTEAKNNSGALANRINFIEMNAEKLLFSDNYFDVVISRNLTWNLPHPNIAYKEWCRVLKPNGLLLNFDANWYNYLFDDKALDEYQKDRAITKELGLDDQNVGENFDVMEEIAKTIPLSSIVRPAWDVDILTQLHMNVTTNTDIWKKVWSKEEQINFASTPMFMIEARKSYPIQAQG